MRVFKEERVEKNISVLKDIPIALEIHQGHPGIVHFRNGENCHIGCLACMNPRCLYFDENKIDCDYIEGFPNDKSTNVCPVDAIAWRSENNAPIIDTQKCIKCGICVSRCPVAALYFTDAGVLKVNTAPSRYIEKNTSEYEVVDKHEQQVELLLNMPRSGVMLDANDQLFETIYSKLFRIKSNYHNVIGRNLLIALGCKCSMRRIGDVYTRMDAIYSTKKGTFGAVEIEFGRDTLDASRGILDDIAVLNTRYGIRKEDNKALVICLQLPNARQGYWQVVRDVRVVEGIKIGTISVGALMILLWNGCNFEPENDRYYIDYEDMNLRRILCKEIDCDDISVSDKELGIVEPMK